MFKKFEAHVVLKRAFFLTYLLLCSSFAIWAQAVPKEELKAIPASEHQVLVELYNTTKGQGWLNQWNDIQTNDVHKGKWHGVTVIDGHVTELNLRDNYLRGELLPQIFTDLPFLASLNLHNNALSGKIPDEIGKAANLGHIFLGKNEFEGAIPKSVDNMVSLKRLYLQENKLDDVLCQFPSGFTTLSVIGQTMERDVFYFKGDTVDIKIPRIFLYNYTNKSFDNQYNYHFEVNGSNRITLKASKEGVIRVPKEILAGLKKDDKVSIYMPANTNSAAHYSRMSYKTTSIATKKLDPLEYDALVAIYDSLNGKGWEEQYRWNISENNLHEGAWYGIEIADGHVVTINLSSIYYKTGKIPKEIGNLPSLRYLNLNRTGSWGYVSGTIPKEIGKLKNLKWFYAENNSLSGEIPKEIGNLESILELKLNSNKLTGEIPKEIGKLQNAVTINISNNQLSGGLPSAFASIPSLTTLYLNSNQLTGSIPKEYEIRTNLYTFNLSSNQFDNIETTLAKGYSLSINYQALNDEIFEYKGDTVDIKLPRIFSYDYNTNAFNAKNRFYLRYDGSNIDTNLVSEEDGTLRIPKESLKGIKKTNKVSIYQSNGYSSGSVLSFDSTAVETLAIPPLEYAALVAIYDSLNGKGWEEQYRWDISKNNLDEGAWHGIEIEDGHIVTINLSDVYYKRGRIPKEIGNLPYLRYLNLNRTGSWGYIIGEMPKEIYQLKNLKWLYIENNTLIGELPKEIGNLENIIELKLSSNQLTGEIPKEMAKLVNATTINLSNNKLEGCLPGLFASMPNLTTLYLNNNQLRGTIPKEYANRIKLHTLQVSNNRLDDIETTLAQGYSLSLNYQNIDREIFKYEGDTVDIQIPRIFMYDYSANTFTTKNRFYLRYDNTNIDTDLFPEEDGIIRIPKESLKGIKKTNKVSLYQANGYSSGSVLKFDSTAVETKKIPPLEYEALVAIYDSLNGKGWEESYRWDVSKNNLHEGAWYGIEIEDGHIVTINLSEVYYKTGRIPKEIGNLPNLRYLNLNRYGGWGYIKGDIPKEIGLLKNLKWLYLENNTLTGALPKEIGQLDNLIEIKLSSNNIEGEISSELIDLPNLISVSLYNNQITSLAKPFNKDKTAIDLRNQRIVFDCFTFKGDTVDIKLPTVLSYEYETESFGVQNTFRVNYNPQGDLLLKPNNEGIISIPKEYLMRLHAGSNLTIRQNEGTASASVISFSKIDFELMQLDNKDFEALTALYDSLNGKGWNTYKWDLSENNLHIKPQPGIVIEKGRVVYINIENEYYIKGSIPSEIGNLSQLRYLNITGYDNKWASRITGEMPKELGKLVNLEELQMSRHEISGSMTFWLDRLESLKTLNLSSNKLTGEIPRSIEKIKGLQTLNLGSNLLTGGIPDLLGNLKHLTYISLQDNQLSGSIPASLNDLPSIKYLYLGQNQFDDLEKPLPYIKDVITVDVSKQTIKRDKILVGGDNVEYTLPRMSRYNHPGKNFVAINKFALYINEEKKVTEEADIEGKVSYGSVYFSELKEDDKISIRQETGSALGSSIVFDEFYVGVPLDEEEFSALKDLYNSTDGANWTNTWNITSNDLHQRMWYGVVVEDGHVIKLELQNNNLSGTLPVSLRKLSKLTHLSLYNNKISGEIPNSLGDIKELKSLLLYKNMMTGTIPASICSVTSLEDIQLKNNNLSGKIPDELVNLTKLTRLNLSENEYEGTIPECLLNLTAIKDLDISYNKFNTLDTPFSYGEDIIVSLQGQTIHLNEYIYTEGTATRVKLAQINKYDYNNKNFEAQNMFEIYVAGIMTGESKIIDEEDMLVFNNALEDYEEGQEVMIIQRNGTTYGSTLNYLGVRDVSQAKINEDEYEALVSIYEALNGDSWTKKWNVEENDIHLGDWHGVSFSNGHITGLELGANKLQGELPNIFDVLTELKEFSITQNKVKGAIPATLTSHKNLTSIAVANNELSHMYGPFRKEVKVSIYGQYVQMLDFPLVDTTIIRDTRINRYDHATTSFKESQEYILLEPIRGSGNIVINDNAPKRLIDMRNEWRVEKGAILQLRQEVGDARYSTIELQFTFKDGDANMDSDLNILDLKHMVNYIFNSHTGSFNYTAADLMPDGEINVLDIVRVANVIQASEMEEAETPSTRSSAVLASLSVEGDTLYMNTDSYISAFDIRLTDIKARDIESLLLESELQVSIKDRGEEVSIVAFSMNQDVELTGKIAIAKVGKAKIKKAILSDSEAKSVRWETKDSNDTPNVTEGSKLSVGKTFNYPNPFADHTTIKYTLPEDVTSADLRVVNIHGLEVRKQVLNDLDAGEQEFILTRDGLNSGMYIYIIEVTTKGGNITYKNKMIIK